MLSNPMEEVVNRFSPPKITETIVSNNESLYLFFSIDICNSTQMKENIRNWFEATKILYNEQFQFMHFWKYNGDEVLYAEPFTTLDTLVDTISKAYLYVKSMQTAIQKELAKSMQSAIQEDLQKGMQFAIQEELQKNTAFSISEELQKSMQSAIHEELQKNIQSEMKVEPFKLKGSFWLARTSPYDSKTKKNIFIKTTPVDEFLGINIDEGFRISKKVSGGKLVIDTKIIYLILLALYINTKNNTRDTINESDKFWQYARDITSELKGKLSDFLSFVHFTNFANLKGVWHDRGYPIFWYYQKDLDCEYDERIDSSYVTPSSIFDDEFKWLDKLDIIYKKVNGLNEIKNILDYIATNKRCTYSYDSISRLYYSIACVNPMSGNILIAKRSQSRKHLKNVWEFSAFKHSSGSIVDSLQKKFLDEFGIEIEIVTDDEKERNIVPLHFCTIYRNGQPHNSILCTAIMKSLKTDEDIIAELSERVDKYRYSEFRFVNKNNIEEYTPIDLEKIATDSFNAISDQAKSFPENSTVMYFNESVSAVTQYHNKIALGLKWYE